MRDITISSIPKEAIFKDVVIIGNGPSGISLSYMLNGNWPYWNPENIHKHPDEFLRARLNYADPTKSLVEQNLIELSDGLEGRSTNPISLLLDTLEHPNADLGMELPSMLKYQQKSTHRKINHIVLGKGPPGGSWHRMDPKLRTLSLATWMSLPGLNFTDWDLEQLQHELNPTLIEHQLCPNCTTKQSNHNNNNNNNNNKMDLQKLCSKCSQVFKHKNNSNYHQNQNLIEQMNFHNLPPRRNLSLKRLISKEVQTRALVSRVAQYYADYVQIMNLESNFFNDAIVTLVAPLRHDVLLETTTATSMKNDNNNHENHQKLHANAKWIVAGINKAIGRPFYYVCKNVVLANGVSDLANRLGLRGEDTKNAWVKHELPELEANLEDLSESELQNLKPVMIVGAGLSAADAVTICRSSNIPVIHVFRSRTAGLDKSLPENVYPEYHEVHRMMKESKNNYQYYTPLPEHTISDLSNNNYDGISGNHRVTVRHLITGQTRQYDVSFCAILIGSRPDLRFTSKMTRCYLKNLLNSSTTSTSLPLPLPLSLNNEQIHSPNGRKMSWLKNLCAKCKHINICDWSWRHPAEYRKISGQQSALNKNCCECTSNNHNKLLCEKDIYITTSTCSIEDSGLGLGIDPTKPIDSKSNQIYVDKYTNEIQRISKGLYAMGPLVGDNFVRFIPGGALAITAALNKEND